MKGEVLKIFLLSASGRKVAKSTTKFQTNLKIIPKKLVEISNKNHTFTKESFRRFFS